MSRLLYSGDGQYLIHMYRPLPTQRSEEATALPSDFDQAISVWDLRRKHRCFPATGYLIGVSDDGTSFLTQVGATSFLAWDIKTGQPMPVGVLEPHTYQRHHRSYLAPSSSGITINDIFEEYPPVEIKINDVITNIALGPMLFGAFSYDNGHGNAGAFGTGYGINTGEVVFDFPVSQQAVYVPFYVAESYHVVYIGEGFKRYSLKEERSSSSDTLRTVDILRGEIASKLGTLLRDQRTLITDIATHPYEHEVAISLQEKHGAIDIWDIQEKQLLFTLPAEAHT